MIGRCSHPFCDECWEMCADMTEYLRSSLGKAVSSVKFISSISCKGRPLAGVESQTPWGEQVEYVSWG
jgi:hypothetical protein